MRGLVLCGIQIVSLCYTPFSFDYWAFWLPWHTATHKKIKYLVVVSGEATNYGKVFYLRTAPQYPHFYMKVAAAHLSNFAQTIGASGYKKPLPLQSMEQQGQGVLS